MAESLDQAIRNAEQQVILETPRLILRAARPSDAIPLHDAFSDPEVMRYWSTPPHTTLERTKEWVSSTISSPQNGITDFIITLKPSQAVTTSTSTSSNNDNDGDGEISPTNTTHLLPIGKIGVYHPLPSNEIGFLLSRQHWGKGLAKEAMTHILKYLFSLPSRSPPTDLSGDSSTTIDTASCSTENTITLSPTTTPATTAADKETIQKYTTLSSPEQSDSLHYRYPSITADVDPRNEASKSLLKRMGFEEAGFVERTDYIGGEWVDSVYFRVEREAWLGEFVVNEAGRV